MDYKGPKLWHQTVGLLSVLDDHSRYLIVLQTVGSTRAELVREQLESAFAVCGMPEGILMDHGVPWWNTLAPMGASQLSLWLMKQGIGLHWSRIRHLQTQGKVERFHGALQRALECRGGAGRQAQAWLDEYRFEHNHVRPHEALGCRLRPAVGSRVSAATKHIQRAGSIRPERGCARWTRFGQSETRWAQLEHQPGAGRRLGAAHPAGRKSPESRCITATQKL
jgi:transposase InsO family protein